MDNQNLKTHSPQSTICLSDNPEGKLKLRNKFKELAAGQKMWGKSPDDVAGAVATIEARLGHLPAEVVSKAVDRHYGFSNEFPSPSDLIGWIRRRGRPPFERAIFVDISKKNYQDRTADEREYYNDYKADRMDNDISIMVGDPHKYSSMIQDSERMRRELAGLRGEISRLDELLKDARDSITKPRFTIEHRVGATAINMRRSGATDEAVASFIDEYVKIKD